MEPRPHGSNAQEIRSYLESEVYRTTQYLCDLKRKINMLAPICKLPEEVLLEIFRVYFFLCWTAGARYRLDTNSSPTHTLRWCWVTHVCHSWRDAAIRCRTLWTYIALPQRSSDYLVTILDRSYDLPVHFRALGHFTPSRMALLEIALSDFSRIATIDFRPRSFSEATPEIGSTFIQQFFNRDAPKLTSLKVDCDYLLARTQDWTLRSALDLSSLQVLDLDGVPFDVMRRFLRPTLTQLRLSWPDWEPRSLVMGLLEPLSRMPLLESLEIQTGYYRSSDGASSTYITTYHDSPIQLPRLRYFGLRSAYRDCGTVLSSISFPTDTGITFHISLSEEEGHFDEPTDTDTLLPVFRKTLRDLATRASSNAKFRPLLSAFLQFRALYGFEYSRILAWNHTRDGEDASGYVLPMDKATVTIDMDDLHCGNSFRALRRFYNTFPLSNLVYLVIRDAQRTCPSAYWTRLVKAVPALEHLDVTGSAHVLICCLDAVAGEISGGSDDGDMVQAHIPLPLPRLTQLVIGPEGRKPRTGVVRDVFIEVLSSTLEMRSQRAHPIRKLKLLWGPREDQNRLEENCSAWVEELLFDWGPRYPKVDSCSEEFMNDSSCESSAEDSESDGDDET